MGQPQWAGRHYTGAFRNEHDDDSTIRATFCLRFRGASKGGKLNEAQEGRKPVLDPVSRVSEVVFGVMMALSFTGSLSVASAGNAAVKTMMLAALGCNIAWGLTDAVMYLIRTVTERHRRVTWLETLAGETNVERAHHMIAQTLPDSWATRVETQALEALRQRLMNAPLPSSRLRASDYMAAFGVFALVALATFPVVLPFMFLDQTDLALRISHGLALITLFLCGWSLGRYAGITPWRYGVCMALIGVVLVLVIVALGG